MQHELIDDVILDLTEIAGNETPQPIPVSTGAAQRHADGLRLYRQQAEALRLNLIEVTKREANGFRNLTPPDPTTAAIHAMRDICLALAEQPRSEPLPFGKSRSEQIRELQQKYANAAPAVHRLTIENVMADMRGIQQFARVETVRDWLGRLEAALK